MLDRLRAAAKKWLGHRYQPWVVILIAVVLVLPSLMAGEVADDYIHRLRLTKGSDMPGFPYAPGDFFVFLSGNREERRLLMEEGMLSWWTAEDLKFRFWRPVSVATHLLDHALWRESLFLKHAHSIAWFTLLLIAVAGLYRRFHVPWIAGLALVLYAVDDARSMALSFLANRNALVAAVFAFSSLLVHDKWRRDGWRPGRWLGPALFAVALLAGEAGLALAGYLVGYAFFLDRGTARQRFISLIPHITVGLAWLTAYRIMGYGTYGSGVYFDPGKEPWLFLRALAERLPVLLLAQFAGPTSDLWIIYPAAVKAAVYLLALLFLGLVARAMWPILKADPAAKFWGFGAVTAAVPVCATFANDRLLVFVGVGAMGLVACLLAAWIDPARRPASGDWHPRSAGTVAVIFIVFHLLLAPLLLPFRTLAVRVMGSGITGIDADIPRDETIRDKTVVVVNAPIDGTVCYVPPLRASRGTPRPKSLRLLATGMAQVEVSRVDPFTLRIRPGNGFLSLEGERLLRGLSRPMTPGYTVRLSDMTVEVTEVTKDGRAAEALFRFSAPLEDPAFLLYRWERGVLAPYVPPPVGRSHTLPAINLLSTILRPGETITQDPAPRP